MRAGRTPRTWHETMGAILSAGLLALSAGALHAEEADCVGYGSLSETPDLTIGRIQEGASRIYFVKNRSDAKACPAAADACRARAYLVPGNRVIVGASRGEFVCVDYIGPKGADRAGWLPATAILRESQGPVAQAEWLGTWARDEALITIKAGKAGELVLRGDATFGAHDPDRVRRGGVNVGEIEGTRAPDGPNLAFAMGTDATLPVEKAEEGDCKVWMRRLGPYLLVDDNNNCGGMNVSFRGAYTKR